MACRGHRYPIMEIEAVEWGAAEVAAHGAVREHSASIRLAGPHSELSVRSDKEAQINDILITEPFGFSRFVLQRGQ